MRREVQILSQKAKIKLLSKRTCVLAGSHAWQSAHNPVFSQSLSTGSYSNANLRVTTARIMKLLTNYTHFLVGHVWPLLIPCFLLHYRSLFQHSAHNENEAAMFESRTRRPQGCGLPC
jgi:hypothetical protein